MASNDVNQATQEVLISRENTAVSDGQLLATNTTNSEPTVEIKDGSDVKKTDSQVYRTKVLMTIWIFCSFVALGLSSAEIGPSFLDLLSLTNSSLAEGSAVITAGSVGYLSGSICTGLFLQPLSYNLLMAVALLGSAVFNVTLTWCPNLILLVLANFLQKFFAAILDTVGCTLCVVIWGKESGPYMQSIQFGFALGGLLSPLIVKPFLSPTQTIHSLATTATNSRNNKNISMMYAINSTMVSSLESQTTESIPNISISNNSLEELSTISETQVHYAYLIIAVITILAAFPFCFNLFKSGKFRKAPKVKELEKEVSLPIKDTIFPLVLILLVYMIYCGMEDGVSVYLTTFTVKYLNWTKQDGSLATFVFWLCFAFGRFLGIFMFKIFSANQMLLMDLTLLNICSFVLLWSKSFSILVWIFYGVSGFAMASVFATGFTWIETYLFKVSGRICSAILVFSSAGTSLNPLLLGFMMEKYSPRWYLYIIFGESLVCSSLFMALAFYSESQYWKNKRKQIDDKNKQSCIE